MQRRFRGHLPAALLLGLALASGCEHLRALRPGLRTFHETRYHPADGLEERQPAEIALAPIRNQSPNPNVPLGMIRSAMYEDLVERLYSPLELGYVDKHWNEASFGGAAPPDALLTVVITHWDTNSLASRGQLLVGAELRLFEGGSATGPLLWGVNAERTVEIPAGARHAGLVRETLPQAIESLSRELLSLLPEHDPVPAQRPAR